MNIRLIALFLLCVSASLRLTSPAAAQEKPTPYRKAMAAVDRAARAFTSYDRDRDGRMEIAEVRKRDEASGDRQGLVLVLVEQRLWEEEPGSGKDDGKQAGDDASRSLYDSDRPAGSAGASRLPSLRPALKTFLRDLAFAGYHAALLTTTLYEGPLHQDGLTVLALRDFLQAVRRDVPDLKGVIMVGNYPNAFLVRQYYWPRDDGLAIRAGTKAEERWDAVRHVRSLAEPVASPCDLVLADLDGHWDTLYYREPQRVGGLFAAFPDDPKREVTEHFEYTATRYEDFFLVQDGVWDEEYLPGGKCRFLFKGEPNTECTDADRRQMNVLARPEIGVGRINAWHAGVVPDPAIKGSKGEGLLDSEGRPQAVEFADEKSVPRVTDLWVPSESLERRLLVEYFDRNHRYRAGEYRDSQFPASVATEWGSSVAEMKADVPCLRDADAKGLDLNGGKVTIADVVTWLKRPALARAIKAHSNGLVSEFGAPPDLGSFERSVGPQTWYWTREGSRLVPSLKGSGGQLNFGLLRSLYENRALPDSPNLYFHTGCESLMPWNYETEPYNSPRCGRWQLDEALMMYGGGLALVGRGKVFYDEPREFWKTLGAGGNWGDAWRRYFEVEGTDGELAKDGIGRKRAYFWSTLGDFTLMLPKSG